MTTDANLLKPRAPFVVVTRKGGFPAATIDEARRLVRPLLGDAKAAVTDAEGQKFSPRAFLEAAEAWEDARLAQKAAAAEAKAAGPGPGHESAPALGMSKDIKHWAAATADIDLDQGPPPGWAPAPKATTGRSSARMPSPASRSSAAHPTANRRTPVDRRTSDRRPQRGAEGGESRVNMIAILIAAGVVLLVVVVFALTRPSAEPVTAPITVPSTLRPAAAPAVPVNPNSNGTIRPEDRPLPTFMR